MVKIDRINAFEVLDSRGNPTVRVILTLSDGSKGYATAPSGASTGKYEAHEKRDGDPKRYGGKGVLSAVESVTSTIAEVLRKENIRDQRQLDELLNSLDGSENKSHLGANAMLAVSMAFARASADHYGMELYEYLGGMLGTCRELPCPMMNILNGGAHSKNNIDIQEFMIVPCNIRGHENRIRASAEIYHTLGRILSSRGHITSVGDEGGYAPFLDHDENAIEVILEAVNEAGYGGKVKLALDAAASEWTSGESGVYHLPKRNIELSTASLTEYWSDMCRKYPIISIEDGLGEEDINGWIEFTEILGNKIMLVGDDLFVTNASRVKNGISRKYANSLLIKPNQSGTVSETIDAALTAKSAGFKLIVSHRSGESSDSFIADLGVALGADFIKSGAPCRSERTEKYNRLTEISHECSNI